MSSLTIFVVPVFGIPASGKSTIISALAERLLSPTVSCKIIELDDILRNKQSSDQEKTSNNNFDISKWFEAREEFAKQISENVFVPIQSPSSTSQEQKETRFIFAVDNLPLKSMRNRIKSLISNKLKDLFLAQSEENQKFIPTIYFQPICISVSNVEIALSRNEKREQHEKIPREIIESTFARVEIENSKDKDLVVLNDEINDSSIVDSLVSKLVTEQIAVRSLNERILTELSPEQQRDDSMIKKSSFESFSHQFDLLRRQANSSIMQRVIAKMKTRNHAVDQNIPKTSGEDATKRLAKILSDKKFVEVDRKILQELSSSSSSFESEEILSMLLSIRDPLLAEFLRE